MSKNSASLGGTRELVESLGMALELPEFFKEATCANSDPQIFDGETLSQVVRAKKVCELCPIKGLCLDWASMTQESGVWGGMTPVERKKYNKGDRPVDIGEIRLLETSRTRLLSSTPASKLAEEFEVTERTIYRWRKKIQITKQAS